MCLIIVKAQGVELPKEKWIRNGASNNSDGTGIMYWKNGGNRVHIKKDFKDTDEVVKFIKDHITKEDSLVIHFRLATSGLTDIGNRHPFPITQNAELLRRPNVICSKGVVHNGVLSTYSGHKKYSDTQKFVMDILAAPAVKRNLNDKAIQKLITDYIGTDKLAIMDSKGQILLFGEYKKDEHLYFSNEGYKTERTYAYYGTGYGNHWNHRYGLWDKYKTKVKKYVEVWEDKCDGCQEHKWVKKVQVENTEAFLCKSCRKKVKSGNLVLHDIITDYCNNCLKEFPISNLTKLPDSGGYVCKSCEQAVYRMLV